MLICYELQSIGLYIFLILAAITINDINMLGVTVLLFAISAAGTPEPTLETDKAESTAGLIPFLNKLLLV